MYVLDKGPCVEGGGGGGAAGWGVWAVGGLGGWGGGGRGGGGWGGGGGGGLLFRGHDLSEKASATVMLPGSICARCHYSLEK